MTSREGLPGRGRAWAGGWARVAVCLGGLCWRCLAQGAVAPPPDLQAAIEARTTAALLREECALQPPEVLSVLRPVMTRADAKLAEGSSLLTGGYRSEAAAAFREAAGLYRDVVQGPALLTRLAAADRALTPVRLLAEVELPPEKTTAARDCLRKVAALLRAGEFEGAVAELDKAREAFAAVLPLAPDATLETAVAARLRMLAARAWVRDVPPVVSRPKNVDPLAGIEGRLAGLRDPDLLTGGQAGRPALSGDLVARALAAEEAAGMALDDRQYALAQALFGSAARLYGALAALQARREVVLAVRDGAERERELAESAFAGPVRPVSFELGRQALADADRALAAEQLETARDRFAAAAEQFAVARREAPAMNAANQAQQAWIRALRAADTEIVQRREADALAGAKAQANEAEKRLVAGDYEAAAAGWTQAAATVTAALAEAYALENRARGELLTGRLQRALAAGEKLTAERLLAELETLMAGDPRMPGLRADVSAMPWPPAMNVPLPGDLSLEMVLVKPGSFVMGSDTGPEDERPPHRVTLTRPFYVGRYEVTQEQWRAVMGTNPSHFQGPRRPVENVTWEECQRFLDLLNRNARESLAGIYVFRLPTEAEWEYACRAGSTAQFGLADDCEDLGQCAWFEGNSGHETHEVGTRAPNAWGLFDMRGNVCEWCADWSGTYRPEDATDPVGPAAGSDRVFRGGSWLAPAGMCRPSARQRFNPRFRLAHVGLRVSLGPPLATEGGEPAQQPAAAPPHAAGQNGQTTARQEGGN